MDNQPKSFIGQLKLFFGFKPGQTLNEFAAEVKALSEKDKTELTDMLNAAGYPVIP